MRKVLDKVSSSEAKMAPSYKLTYFNVTALGESIRFLFSYGGIEFEDNRVTKDSWPALKPNTPFGQLPILEYNGKIGYQSVAIARYVAKQVKLVGKDDWEDLEIDATVDTILDLRLKIIPYYIEQDKKTKETKGETLFNETVPFCLGRLDAQVKNGYLVGGHLTWADLFFTAGSDFLSHLASKDIFADYPNLQKVIENVLEIPNIKAWVEKRPKEN